MNLRYPPYIPGIMDFYVRDCCNHAAETKEIVRGVHKQKGAVARQCLLLAGLQLTRIDKNVVYNDRDFAKQQADHCVSIRAKVIVYRPGICERNEGGSAQCDFGGTYHPHAFHLGITPFMHRDGIKRETSLRDF